MPRFGKETACQSVGFEIAEADYTLDARLWWEEYAKYDEGCQEDLPRDREAAHRAEVENIAAENAQAVTCKKCWDAIRKMRSR